MLGKIIANRYEIKQKVENLYYAYKFDQLSEYKAFDKLHKKYVRIKLYELPEKNTARQLAITLWERELRLIQKSFNFKGGEVITKIVDAAIEDNENKLYIVYQDFGLSLEEWKDHPEGLWLYDQTSIELRTDIWQLSDDLLSGLSILHQSKILHRNINPSTIFYSELSDNNNLRLGGISWSLYLHNLDILNNAQLSDFKKLTLFQLPKNLVSNENEDNIFADDIFSIGMVLAYIFIPNFPIQVNYSSIDIWKADYDHLIDEIRKNENLEINEKNIILSAISLEGKSRYKSIFDMKIAIKNFLHSLSNKENKVTDALKVNWYNTIGSYFLNHLSYYVDFPIDEIMEDPNTWLQHEFKDAEVFASTIKTHPLIIVTKNEGLYSVHPIINKQSGREYKDVLQLRVLLPVNIRRDILRKINDKYPLTTLHEGLIFTTNRLQIDPHSKWRILYAKAFAEINKNENNEDENPFSNFIYSLNKILEAEKDLDSQKMLVYRKKNAVKRDPAKKLETAEIMVSKNFNANFSKKEREEIRDMLFDYMNNDGGAIELKDNSDPASSWDNYREWKIKKVKQNLDCVIEREIKSINRELDYEGVIRPFEMNLSLKLYRRKERLIDNLENNNHLLTSIINPESTTFYLGIDKNKYSEVLSNIINTIPMFLVQGPPGTGKTWIASTLISKLIESNPNTRILVASKDHEPLDHLVEAVHEKLEQIDLDDKNKPIIVRLMSSEREQEYTSSDLVFQYSSQNKFKEILIETKNRLTDGKLPKNVHNEWKKIINENIENPSVIWTDEIQKVANIVFATATSAKVEWLSRTAIPYDWVIIEEAAKSYPVELLLPMNLGQRWLLIGDQKQLPPFEYNKILLKVNEILDGEQLQNKEDEIVYSAKREDILSNIKLFEKLYSKFEDVTVLFSQQRYNPCDRLEKQWRMPPLIADMIATIFYENRFDIMKDNPQEGDPFIKPEIIADNVLTWFNTPHASENPEYKDKKDDSGSTYNQKESKIIVELLQNLKFKDNYQSDEYEDVVILAPYNAQIDLIQKEIMNNEFEEFDANEISRKCYTIDSYQGKQANVVIISLVRNNTIDNIKSALGFLIEDERLNVMFSRVRKRMIIIGSAKQIEKFKGNSDINAIEKILDYIQVNGEFIDFEKWKEGNL